jgi:hypothetical protein
MDATALGVCQVVPSKILWIYVLDVSSQLSPLEKVA